MEPLLERKHELLMLIHDRLQAEGVQLQFQIDAQTGRVALRVYDQKGTMLGTLAPSQLLDIAYNGSLE